MRVVALQAGKDVAKCAAHRSSFLGASARNDGRPEAAGELEGKLFSDEYQRSDEAKLSFSRIGNRRQGAEASGEHCITQESFAKVVGSVAKSNDVSAQLANNVVNSPA